jgi:hypothetical protein
MLRNERSLRRQFARRVDSYDSADAPVAVSPQKTQLMATQGNPAFTAQFDIQILLRYFSVAAGAYTLLTPAAVLAASSTLTVPLNAFIFGNSDFSSGYAKLQSQFPVTTWTYGAPFIYGKDYPIVNGVALDATALAQLTKGDLVIPYYATVGGTDYQAFVIVRCTQVAYGTLLDALNSDMFTMNMIRYIMSDTSATGLAQYNNNIFVMKQSLFGKFDSDFISPNSFKLPEQMQDGVIDIPLVKGIDKQIALATAVNYNVSPVQWSLFVAMVNKLAY